MLSSRVGSTVHARIC